MMLFFKILIAKAKRLSLFYFIEFGVMTRSMKQNVEIANSSAEISERVDRVAKDILDDVNKKKF